MSKDTEKTGLEEQAEHLAYIENHPLRAVLKSWPALWPHIEARINIEKPE